MKAERFTDIITWHGEGAVWWPDWGLRLVDGYRGEIVSVDADGHESGRLEVGAYAGVFRPRIRGGLVVGIERGFALVDEDGTVTKLPELWSDTEVRMNEGACDPAGAFYCGSLREVEPRDGDGSVYRMADPAAPPTVALAGQTIPNGLVFDGDVAYFIDTPTKTVRCFDVAADGSWHDPRISVDLRDVGSSPDGMTMDADGRLWIAMWGERGEVRCHEPGSSEPETVIAVADAHHVTSVAFGGADLDELYITTSQQGDGAGPAAGALFRAIPGVRGRLVLPYRF